MEVGEGLAAARLVGGGRGAETKGYAIGIKHRVNTH